MKCRAFAATEDVLTTKPMQSGARPSKFKEKPSAIGGQAFKVHRETEGMADENLF
jgi:hypothetical protein